MMLLNRSAPSGLTCSVLFLCSFISGPAQAAPPSNDTISGATVVTAVYSETLDTTEATTDADDAQLNASCGAPATDASVWYSFAGTGTSVVVDASQSDYSAGVLVGSGTQGSLTTVTCGPGAVAFFAAQGTTYYALAIDDQLDGTGNGGSLAISFNEVLSPVLEELTLNRFGSVNPHTGVATISGSYTCSNGDFLQTSVDARQQVGRVATIIGSGSFFGLGTCDGLPHNWSADIVPQSGKFAGGKSMTVAFGFTCGQFECATGFAERTVQLRSNMK